MIEKIQQKNFIGSNIVNLAVLHQIVKTERQGFLFGFISGIITSIIGSFIYNAMKGLI